MIIDLFFAAKTIELYFNIERVAARESVINYYLLQM